MRILDHQQFWEYRQAECAKCIDLPYYDVTEANPNMCVQVGLDSNNITIANSDFTSNPFNEITSTDLTFDITAVGYVMELQLYIQGKVYLIKYGTTVGPNYDYVITGNTYNVTIKYGSLSLAKLNLRQFLIDIIDVNHSTTSSLLSATFTIANIPSGSYVNNHSFADSIATITAATGVSQWFSYLGGKMCYNTTSEIIDDDFYYKITLSLTAGERYKFSFDYSALYSDYTLNLVVYDGTNTTTIPLTYTITTSGTIDAYYTALITIDTDFTITLTDPSTHNTGFCFDNISLSEVCLITDVTIGDYVFTEGVDMTLTYSGDNVLICMDGFTAKNELDITACYQLTITDSCATTTISNYFKFYSANCGLSLIKLEWYGDCTFGLLDYVNLSMVNSMYVKGYKKRIPQQLDDRVTSRNPDGSVSTIFSITSKRYEFNFGKYTEVLHEQLERVFENKFIFVDGVEYYKDGKDVYQIRDLNNGYYLGGIELTKKGSEVIASACCC